MGVLDVVVKVVKLLEEVFAYFLALRHQLDVCGGIGERRHVGTRNELIDAVQVLDQTLLGQNHSANRAVDDNPGAATLNVFDHGAFSAMAVLHQFFQVQVLVLCELDIVRAGEVDLGSRRSLRIRRGIEVVVQQGVGGAGLGIESPGVGVGGIGQGQLTTQGAIGPPAWQPAANGGRPQRVQPVSHVAEHRTATGTTALDYGAVHRVMSIPVPRLVEGDGLFVGAGPRAVQAPALWIAAQFDAVDTPVADHEIAVGVSIDIAIDTVAPWLQAGQRNLVFVLVAPEALQGMPGLSLRGHVQGARAVRHAVQMAISSGGAGNTRRRRGAGQHVHCRVNQRQQHCLNFGQTMTDLSAQECRHRQVGATPGVVQRHGGAHERQHAHGHFQIIEHRS
ncbi:hypothetical protein D3C72_426790 [compost metagenome]